MTPDVVPGAPAVTGVTPGDQKVTVAFSAPVGNGSTAVTGYRVTSTPGGITATGGPSATSIDVTGLTNGTSYTFTVAAQNAQGYGAESPASGSATPRTVPGAPTITAATPTGTSVAVTFSAPASDGGSAVTLYTVTAHQPGSLAGDRTQGGVSSPITVTGLVDGLTWDITVTATNAAGAGPDSAARTIPGAPTITTVTPGDTQASVAFTIASPGVPAITSYTVTATPAVGSPVTASGAASPVSVTGLTNGTPYTFTVHATNATADGFESAARGRHPGQGARRARAACRPSPATPRPR